MSHFCLFPPFIIMLEQGKKKLEYSGGYEINTHLCIYENGTNGDNTCPSQRCTSFDKKVGTTLKVGKWQIALPKRKEATYP